MTSFGTGSNVASAKFLPYLYDRIKNLISSFSGSSILSSDRDNVLIPSDQDGSNPDYSTSDTTFKVFEGGINQTSNWTIDVLSESNVVTSQVSNTISITSLTGDDGSYVVRAVRPDYNTITKTIYVYRSRFGGQGLDGLGWTSGSYNNSTGIVTFTSDDGLGFVTDDLRGSGSGGTQQNPSTLSIIPNDEGGLFPGNTRGNGAVDLQTFRTDPSKVASGSASVISGGDINISSGTASTVSGGSSNSAIGNFSVVSGGNGNSATGFYSNISGGDGQTIDSGATESGICSGNSNRIYTNSLRCFIGGGNDNRVQADSYEGVIAGGGSNELYGRHNFIPGGFNNTITSPSDTRYSSCIGSQNSTSKPFTNIIGYGGVGRTNGEVVMSLSESTVQKSTLLLEISGASAGTLSPITLGRSSQNTYGEYIQTVNNTAFFGHVELLGVQNTGNICRERYLFSYSTDGAGVSVIKQLSALVDSSYTGDGISGTLAAGTLTGNQIQLQITTAASQINWTCLVEGVLMDRYS